MTTKSIYTQVGDAIVARLRALDLCAEASVLPRKFPWIQPRGVVPSPAILVTLVPEQLRAATNESDDWTIGHAVACCKLSNAANEIDETDESLLLWRERIIQDLLRDKRLADCPEVVAVDVEPGSPWDAQAFAANWDASILIIRSQVRRNRRGAQQT